MLETLRGGGLNTEPLGQTIDQYMDENAIRASHIKYGLVITEMNTLRSVQCTLDDIPQGQLKDYMLASSACFPALRPYEIDGVKYIDGGWRDNMPLELAAKMGATELIGVDVDGVGLTRPNLTGLPTRIIRSHWDLGPLFDFDGVRAAKNIALGYMDTMREFGRLGGTAYGILPDENSFMQDFAVEYQAQLSAAISRAPTLALTEALARQHKHYPAAFSENLTAPTRGAIAPLELAAEMVDVPSEVPYTPKLLALTFMGQCDKDPADRYKLPAWPGRGQYPWRSRHGNSRAGRLCYRAGQPYFKQNAVGKIPVRLHRQEGSTRRTTCKLFRDWQCPMA